MAYEVPLRLSLVMLIHLHVNSNITRPGALRDSFVLPQRGAVGREDRSCGGELDQAHALDPGAALWHAPKTPHRSISSPDAASVTCLGMNSTLRMGLAD